MIFFPKEMIHLGIIEMSWGKEAVHQQDLSFPIQTALQSSFGGDTAFPTIKLALPSSEDVLRLLLFFTLTGLFRTQWVSSVLFLEILFPPISLALKSGIM